MQNPDTSLNNRADELKNPHARIDALEAVENRLGLLMAASMDARLALKAKQDAPLPNGIRPGERVMRVEHLLNDTCALAEFELGQLISEISDSRGAITAVGEATTVKIQGR